MALLALTLSLCLCTGAPFAVRLLWIKLVAMDDYPPRSVTMVTNGWHVPFSPWEGQLCLRKQTNSVTARPLWIRGLRLQT